MTAAGWTLIAVLHWVAPCAVLLSMHATVEHDPDDPASALRLARLARLCRRGAWFAWGAAVVADVMFLPSLGTFLRLHHGVLDVVGIVLLVLQIRLSRPAA